tara:strand:+ start:224 stop:535 length:312 start_codon:yes stop_codon:yes gene_type:complete
MKNIQSYIIAGMTILIVVLFWFLNSANSKVDQYKEQIELSKLKEGKTVIFNSLNSQLNDLSKLSSETVIKSNKIIKKITHETTKISDTTDVYMLEYVRNYRPE